MRAAGSWATRLAGALALAAAAGTAHAGGDAVRGEQKFEDCIACHLKDRTAAGLGPSLYGVLGRKAGEGSDFRYSPAMRRSGITWTPQALETFVADPQAMVPANRMPYGGMPDAGDRADLIAYLEKAFK
jgi:cytochrome c